MVNLIKKIQMILCCVFVAFLFINCRADIKNVKSGEIHQIPFTRNLAIGTDSTIVIVNRETGKTLNVISRKKNTNK